MRYSIACILGCAWLALATPSIAETEGPYKLNESILGFELGKHTLEDIQAKLGRSVPISPREGEPFKICYVSNQQPEIFVVFEAMIKTASLLAFTVTSDISKIPERDECIKSSILSQSILTAGTLKLGMTRAQLQKVFGKASKSEGNKLSYIYQAKVRMSEEEMKRMEHQWPDEVKKYPYWNLMSIIAIELLKNKIVSMRVSKTETY
ncbi:MAG: hypothetical protein ABL869_03000 [Candidatus Nitrotoga sp.]